MNHLKQIAARLPEYGLDAMLLNSEPGEYYAVGFHGEGNVVVTAQGCFYFTDSRYIEAANHLITGAEIAMTGRSRNYRAMVQEVVNRCRIRKLGFEEGYLSVADYNLWKEGLTAELVPAQKLVNSLRAAKDEGEIADVYKRQAHHPAPALLPLLAQVPVRHRRGQHTGTVCKAYQPRYDFG